VQTKTPQGEAAGTVTYGYDYSGRMLQATDGSSSMPYEIEYDTAGRANSFTDQLGRNTKVAYDGVGNQTEVVWPAGTSGTGSYSVIYKYDAMNQMQTVNEGGTNKLLAQYSWDALSRAHSISYGDGTSDSYSQYDAGDNLQTLTQTYNGSNNSVTVSGWSAPVDQSRGRVFEVRTDLRSVHLF
jgi:YD repeat-containing protein